MPRPTQERYLCHHCSRTIPHKDVRSGEALVLEQHHPASGEVSTPLPYCRFCADWLRAVKLERRSGFNEGLRRSATLAASVAGLFEGLTDNNAIAQHRVAMHLESNILDLQLPAPEVAR